MNKGVALYISVIVMALLLIIVFGLTLMTSNQIKMVRGTEQSVRALYAADAGIERALVDIIHNIVPPHVPDSGCILNGVIYNYCDPNLDTSGDTTYYVEAKCCKIGSMECKASAVDCAGIEQADDCNAKFYCVKSIGTYKETIRGVSVDI